MDGAFIPVDELFADYMETILEPGELLTAVLLPPPGQAVGSAYVKHRVRGIDTAIVGVGVGLTLAADGVDVRIGRHRSGRRGHDAVARIERRGGPDWRAADRSNVGRGGTGSPPRSASRWRTRKRASGIAARWWSASCNARGRSRRHAPTGQEELSA